MTAEEWHRLTKTTGMTMYFRAEQFSKEKAR